MERLNKQGGKLPCKEEGTETEGETKEGEEAQENP